MKSNKKTVMIFGGSYNPIHQGHINAALATSSQLGVDEVWLMPRKYNYDGSLLLDGKHRVKMIEMAIKHLNNFKVCDVELKDNNKKLIYSYNTAKKLTRMFKDIDFYFLIGADQLNNLKLWYKAEELCKLMHFVVYKRPGYIINYDIVNQFNVKIVDGPTIDTSSTLIRSGVFQKIDEEIQTYIMEQQLYLKERVMPKLPEERFIHVLSTARIAKRIAKSLGVDTNRAYVAGILHDIAKGLTKEEIKQIIIEHYPNKLKFPKYSYHAFASAYIAKTQFGITDSKILKAIENHAKASKKMSKLDKIIYCADKLEESRPFAHTLDEIREIAYYDIDKCFVLVMKDQLEYLRKSNSNLDEALIDNISYYERKLLNGR